jgi:hypothetical protein
MDLMTATLRVPDGFGRYPSDAHWQTKLEAAQNVLFCKELFSQVPLLLCLETFACWSIASFIVTFFVLFFP